jgi:D-beta-D-heptose 7-phosphate kinase/D-beta-D-heptose 1-phosphate adenosyltransferase
MSRSRLVVVGDSLLDRDLDGRVNRLSPDAPVPVVDGAEPRPRPGGAALAAALAAADGRPVTLVTAIGNDEAGHELRRLLDQAGVDLVDLRLEGQTPEKVRIRGDGRTLLRLDRGGPRPARIGPATEEARRALATGAAVLVSDYGWGVAAEPVLRAGLSELAHQVPVIWDPHPNGSPPVPGARLVTPNRFEAGAVGLPLGDVAERGRRLLRKWRAAAVAITMGGEGAILVTGDGPPLAAPAPRLAVLDACGAGDRFACTAAALLGAGATPAEAVTGAVASASEFVAAGGAAGARLGRPAAGILSEASPTDMERALRLISAVRAKGGRVVATGGCFDLLHAGHVASLQAARRLGDCLVVCLNSDSSVRRLKGPGRPVLAERDRGAVLAALACVDAVVVFDEATPEAVLRRLRPDIFAKGGDYAVARLPEAKLLRSWGGEVVLLPYLEGRSTTQILEEMSRRGG